MNMTQGIVSFFFILICSCLFGIYGFIGSVVICVIDASIAKEKKHKEAMKELRSIKAELKKKRGTKQ